MYLYNSYHFVALNSAVYPMLYFQLLLINIFFHNEKKLFNNRPSKNYKTAVVRAEGVETKVRRPQLVLFSFIYYCKHSLLV